MSETKQAETRAGNYYGHCPKCGEMLGFGHLPEKCQSTIEAAMKDGRVRTGYEWTLLGWNAGVREIIQQLRRRAELERGGRNQYTEVVLLNLADDLENEFGYEVK